MQRIARYVNEDFAMYSGNDDMITSMLSLGASRSSVFWPMSFRQQTQQNRGILAQWRCEEKQIYS